MPAPGQPWPLDLKVIACIFHSIAISSGIFRSAYHAYISRFGWEDGWALLALLTDVGCLVCSWLQRSAPAKLSNTDVIINLAAAVTVTSVPWEARLSIITTIIRIADPRTNIRRTSYALAVSFGLMWIALLVQKLYVCCTNSCIITHEVAIFQLATDVVSDLFLVVMPIFFLKGMKVPRTQRLLLVLSFASSICITIVSIVHSISLFMPLSGNSILFVHIKAALALIICNLLVIVIFAYRFWNKIDIDPGGISTKSEVIQFTTVIPDQSTLRNFYCSTPSPRSSVHRVSTSCA